MKCHRCGVSMTIYVVDWDYCHDCTREMRVRAQQDRRMEAKRLRFRTSKDTTNWQPVA